MRVFRGDVYLVNLSPNELMKSESIRPCLIVQNDIANRFAPTVIVAALTNQINEPKLPTHVKIDRSKYGLESDYILLMEQIRTINKSRLLEKLFTLDDHDMEQVDVAWCLSGGVNPVEDIKDVEDEQVIEKKTEMYYEFYLNEEVVFLSEDYEAEFKAPLDPNNSDEIIKLIEEKLIKYVVAFLNGNGGSIFFGIDDNRIVKGLILDYKQRDTLLQKINNKLNDRIMPKVSLDYFYMKWHSVNKRGEGKIRDCYVLEITVKKPYDPIAIYFDNGKTLYIKTSSGIQKYDKPYEMVSAITKRIIENKDMIEMLLKNNKLNI
jgi:mRNA-degrading endonuclease toxin of MazEF toxin-antitoxin module